MCGGTHSGAWTIQSATAGIQEAAQGAPNGQVFVPVGTYNTFGPVTLNPPTTAQSIVCAGWGSKLVANSGTQNVIQFYGNNASTVSECLFDSSGTQSAGAAVLIGNGSTDNSFGASVNHIKTTGNMFDGINIQSGGVVSVTNNVLAASDHGLWIQNLVNGDQGDNTVIGNNFSSSGSASPVKWTSGGGIKFIGNKVVANTALSIEVNMQAPTSDAIFEGNSIESFGTAGISITASGSAGNQLGQINIVGNQFASLTGEAVLIGTSSGSNRLTAVVIDSNVSNGVQFLSLGANVEGIIVSNNFSNLETLTDNFQTFSSPTTLSLMETNNTIVGAMTTGANPYGSYANMTLVAPGAISGGSICKSAYGRGKWIFHHGHGNRWIIADVRFGCHTDHCPPHIRRVEVRLISPVSRTALRRIPS